MPFPRKCLTKYEEKNTPDEFLQQNQSMFATSWSCTSCIYHHYIMINIKKNHYLNFSLHKLVISDFFTHKPRKNCPRIKKIFIPGEIPLRDVWGPWGKEVKRKRCKTFKQKKDAKLFRKRCKTFQKKCKTFQKKMQTFSDKDAKLFRKRGYILE